MAHRLAPLEPKVCPKCSRSYYNEGWHMERCHDQPIERCHARQVSASGYRRRCLLEADHEGPHR